MCNDVPRSPAYDPTASVEASTSSKVLESLPQPSKLRELLYNLKQTVFTEEEVTRAWFEATTLVKKYSDDRVTQWQAEIQNYLIFAALFSGILTAFNVECFSLLQPTDTASTSPQPIPLTAILLNMLLFASLMFSLCSAFVGTLVLQWLKTFCGELPGDSRLTAWLRQSRLNNLDKWHVERFARAVPVLLQVSLILFLAGLLVLLWTLNTLVFAIVCALAAVLTFVLGGTAILPLIRSTCAYLSPQTFALYLIGRYTLYVVRHPISAVRRLYRKAKPMLYSSPFDGIQSSSQAHLNFFQRWRQTNTATPPTADPIEDPVESWQEHERSIVRSPRVRRQLDIDILHTAYKSTLDPNALEIAAACLIRGDPVDIVEWFRRLESSVDPYLPSDEGVTTSFTLSNHGARTVLWAILLHSMIQLHVRGDEYVAQAWKRAAFQLAECLSSAYRHDQFRLSKAQLDWVVCVILWAVWPVPIEDALGHERRFDPTDGVVPIKGLTDAFHDLLHNILIARRSNPDKADVISPDVAEFGQSLVPCLATSTWVHEADFIDSLHAALVLGLHRLRKRTVDLHTRPATIADWFNTACANVDLMVILSQISPMKIADGTQSFQAPASMELEPNHFVDERPHRLNLQQFMAIGKEVLLCLSDGLKFNATPAQSINIKWSMSDLLVVVPHLYQTLGEHAQLFVALMPSDLLDVTTKFNNSLAASLTEAGHDSVAASLSALLKYTLRQFDQIVNPSARGT
ncbi:hypothetical protein NUW54_g2196 [Trametes sanguinea]|uniref:Uncharacterized protein n=1 Tax=Trametes sanguinea TaxID=158606 RepID=A0ACC1Q5J7_9APHY|nr:hypothetical protein NUW54_g2196 [Trametes sanguinea]